MSQIQHGETARPFSLPSIDGSLVSLEGMKGKRVLISFMRFAKCPFCNLRIHQLVKSYSDLGPQFAVIAIFDSPLDHLRQSVEGHHAPFPILADEKREAYKAYHIQNSVTGVLKGMIFRMPSLLKAMLVHGYFPTSLQGSVTTMPADFLVDEFGIVRRAYYGVDEGDHLSFEEIRVFATGQQTA